MVRKLYQASKLYTDPVFIQLLADNNRLSDCDLADARKFTDQVLFGLASFFGAASIYGTTKESKEIAKVNFFSALVDLRTQFIEQGAAYVVASASPFLEGPPRTWALFHQFCLSLIKPPAHQLFQPDPNQLRLSQDQKGYVNGRSPAWWQQYEARMAEMKRTLKTAFVEVKPGRRQVERPAPFQTQNDMEAHWSKNNGLDLNQHNFVAHIQHIFRNRAGEKGVAPAEEGILELYSSLPRREL